VRVQVRFLLGPAGTGKTYHCLNEIRRELSGAPEGPPLVLLAPKQTTYELERQLLSTAGIGGYTRLQILSFERFADYVFAHLAQAAPELLDEEGRVMVLRALLARTRNDLKLFRASARLTGFAQQLSRLIGELQRTELTPESLRSVSQGLARSSALAFKLQYLATLLEQYDLWLHEHGLQDRESLLTAATELLTGALPRATRSDEPETEGRHLLWVDGFAEFSASEIGLLSAFLPHCSRSTITFCLDRTGAAERSWLSGWSLPLRAFEHCRKRLSAVDAAEVSLQLLGREPDKGRYSTSAALRHLEHHWADGESFPSAPHGSDAPPAQEERLTRSLRAVRCADLESEASLAAREILTFVRSGGRYREAAILVRSLPGYHRVIERVFSAYDIPFFLDRRASIAHHPVAELTRSALRTVTLGWQHEDWFAALKTGLVPATDGEIDQLENEALARGWTGAVWQQPVRIREVPRDAEARERLLRLEAQLEELRQKVMPPFQRLALKLKLTQNKPTGTEVSSAIRDLWTDLRIQDQCEGSLLRSEEPGGESAPSAAQETVWTQLNNWLQNLDLAFHTEALPLREWLPILEAGLANLTIGLIPPALDQVLVGTIDRSRNPGIKLGLVLGLNEGVFPALPETSVLLTENDCVELEKHNVPLGLSARQQLGRERYFAYVACTRARERLVLTCAARDERGAQLLPSPFWMKVGRMFPQLEVERAVEQPGWRDCLHPNELFGALLKSGFPATNIVPNSVSPQFASGSAALDRLVRFRKLAEEDRLSPAGAQRLYGDVLRTSVSRMEQFAACEFKFLVHSGLRAEDRKRFELDVKERGSFQHDVLALFHEQLRGEGKRWRDITPEEARARVAAIAGALVDSYREGLLKATDQTRFLARVMSESLQDFVEVLVGWMREHYGFDPVEVELPFGESEAQPPWTIPLANGQRLELYGRIDRVDLVRAANRCEAFCVVLDYKSGQKQLDPVLTAHGLQLQLLAYLNVLRRWPNPSALFGVERLIPAGVFYVNLNGKYGPGTDRREALGNSAEHRRRAYRHSGRFDLQALCHLDGRPGATEGEQFNYRRNKDGSISKNSREALAPEAFLALLDSVEANLALMGQQVYSGASGLNPYRKGTLIACDRCDYRWVCRIDPWTHQYRSLSQPAH
jgi:ATP-dependent helicase/nuclease subunit B